MRLCGAFRDPEQLSCPEQRPQAHRVARESIRSVRRRLDLLYPDRHNLLLIPEEDTFLVSLTLTARKYATEMLIG